MVENEPNELFQFDFKGVQTIAKQSNLLSLHTCEISWDEFQ